MFPTALNDVDQMLQRLQRRRRAQNLRRLTRNDEKLGLMEELYELGFKVAGKGKFAVTMVRGRWAVKFVLTRHSNGALAYLRSARAAWSTNDLVPRVMRIREVGRYSVVLMERLFCAVPEMNKVVERNPTARALTAAIEHRLGQIETVRAGYRRRLKSLGHHPRQVAETVKKVAAVLRQPKHQSAWLDVHGGNVLFRKGRVNLRPVLTDPIAH